jgi:hypothetical protein
MYKKSRLLAGFFVHVPPAGFEPAIHGLKTRCPRPLDEGGARNLIIVTKNTVNWYNLLSFPMSTKKETKKRTFDWGDGHEVEVPDPNLDEIPGDSMICPMPCFPVGEDEKEWKKHEKGSGRPKRKGKEEGKR